MLAKAEPEALPPAPPAATSPGVADLELHLLLEAVYRVSGYDFREYAPATLKRRISERVRSEGAATISGLLERVLHEPPAMSRFIEALTHNTGSPFREPQFFNAFRERVLPRLRTFPHVRIWVVGSGEDAYSLAILLREAEFYHRTRIYATDASEVAIDRAKAGAFPAELIDEYSERYLEAGEAGISRTTSTSSGRRPSSSRACASRSSSRSTTSPATARSTSSTSSWRATSSRTSTARSRTGRTR